MLKFHDVEQNESEWFELRAGGVGGSSIGCIMANFGKSFGEPAKKLASKVAVEQITGKPILDGYTNVNMQRGHEQEGEARELYELETFSDVTNGGIYIDGNRKVSPDGMVGNDGLIEIKSVISSQQMATIEKGKYSSSYKWQLYYNLLVTGREWIDYSSYCADFPTGKQLFIYRIYAKDAAEEFAKINVRLDEFFELVNKKKEIINNL